MKKRSTLPDTTATQLARAKLRAWNLSECANQTPDEVWRGLSQAARDACLRDVGG